MTITDWQEPKPNESEDAPEEKPSTNIISLVATGGGDGGGPWLNDWEIGACLLLRAKEQKTAMLHEFWIVARAVRATKLLNVQGDKETYMWVDPWEFCKDFKLYEVVH